MNYSPIEYQIRFEKLIWLVVILAGAALCGYALATNSWFLVAAAAGAVGLFTLPYHSTLSIYLSVAAYSSAIIMPLFPGRPYVWEFAALLGWTGMVPLILFRRHSPDSVNQIKANSWLFVGLQSYIAVLVVTLFLRGFGLRILGSELVGGRFYFQQIACSIFPWLFVLWPMSEKTLLRLLILQCLLTSTFLISDFLLAYAPEQLYFLFQFFELSGDAANFEIRAMRFGIRRFQSLFTVSIGLFYLLLIFFNLRDFLTRKGAYLLLVLMAVIGTGLLSGHRYLVVVMAGVALTSAIAQKFLTLRNTMMSLAPVTLALVLIYAYSDRMSLSAQRAISFLPGIRVDSEASSDAAATLDTRQMLAKIGFQIMPTYFWLGRGFGVPPQDYSSQRDPTGIQMHLNQGRFFNGFIGLMVNTGVFGTISMLIFMFGGTLLAIRIVRYLRLHGCEDSFSRMCCVLAGQWLANALAFLFLHGDSEYAMKTFSLQAGLLLACHLLLRKRLEAAATSDAVS